jgi:hypothetical protein
METFNLLIETLTNIFLGIFFVILPLMVITMSLDFKTLIDNQNYDKEGN